jgi:cytochrome P450
VRPVIAGDMSIITLDGEEHVRTRRLINAGFTPRRVRDLMPHVRQLTNELSTRSPRRADIDFVEEFAIHVPLIIICELMGLNPEQRMKMYRWSDDMMAGDGHVEGPVPHSRRGSLRRVRHDVPRPHRRASRRPAPTTSSRCSPRPSTTARSPRSSRPVQGISERAGLGRDGR